MIKVIHVISDTNIGGAGTVLLTTLHNINRSKFDVKVVLPAGSKLIPRVDALGFEHICTKGGADKSFDPRAVHEYCRISCTRMRLFRRVLRHFSRVCASASTQGTRPLRPARS